MLLIITATFLLLPLMKKYLKIMRLLTSFPQDANSVLWPVCIWRDFIPYHLVDIYSPWWPETRVFCWSCKPLARNNGYTPTIQKINNSKWQHAGGKEKETSRTAVAKLQIQTSVATAPFFVSTYQLIQHACF